MPKSSRVRFRSFLAWNIHAVVLFQFFSLLFSWSLCYLYCFSLLYLVFLCSFYVAFGSSDRCIDAIFNAGKSFVCSCHLSDVKHCASSWVFLFSSQFVLPLSTSRIVPKYLTRRSAKVFIPLMKFLFNSLVSISFLLLGYSFRFFSFISTCLMVSASSIPKYLQVPFSPIVLTLSWFVSSILSVICRFPHLIINTTGFSHPNSIPISYVSLDCVGISSYILYFWQIGWRRSMN